MTSQAAPAYRDKSWGPRYCPASTGTSGCPSPSGREFGVLLSIKGRPEGGPNRISGNVLRNGVYEPVIDGHIDTDYGPGYIPRGLTATVGHRGRQLHAHRARAGHRAAAPQARGSAGAGSYTRITEGMTEFRCNGLRALGMTEYCDVMNDGVPISVALAKAGQHEHRQRDADRRARDDGLVTVTLNRPQAKNALSPLMADELTALFTPNCSATPTCAPCC